MMMLQHEIRLALKSKEFYISFVIGIILMSIHYFEVIFPSVKYIDISVREGMLPHSVFSKWVGASGSSFVPSLYFFLFPLLASFPFGASFYQDSHNGYLQQMVLLNGRKKYFLSKYVAIFLAGGLATTLPLLFELYAAAMTLPSIIPVMVAGYFPWQHGTRLMPYLPYTDPYAYVGIYMAIIFMFAGAMAGLSATVSPVSRNTFIVWIAPLIMIRCAGSIATFLGESRLDPMYFLNPIQYIERISWKSLILCFLVLWIPSFVIYFWKGIHGDIF